ncbi:hypothetical protein Ancab_021505 [Ancistrocladus abbreviatus]
MANIKRQTGANVSGRALHSGDAHVYMDMNLNNSANLETHDGMEFESKEEAFIFYKEYAKSSGFAAIIKSNRRTRISGNFIDAKFVCTRYRNKRESKVTEDLGAIAVMDCTASVSVKRR